MNSSPDQTRVVVVAAVFSLQEQSRSLAKVAGLASAGVAGTTAAVALTLSAFRREALAAAMIAIQVGSALLAVAATRESSEYEPSVVLLLVAAGAILAVVYGVLARRLLQPSWKACAALAVVALTGAVSVATLLAVTVPLVVINVWTWRTAANDDKAEVE